MAHSQRSIALTLFTLLALVLVPAVTTAASTDVLAKGAQPLDTVEKMFMPYVDNQTLLAEDDANQGPGVPLRIATSLPVNYTPQTHGTWEILADGSRLWQLRIESPNALNINLGFARYNMPAGGKLMIYNSDASMVQGPYTQYDNKSHGQLWTAMVDGSEVILEAQVPADRWQDLELNLTTVNHGYRSLDGADKSGSCNVDVVCSEGNAWRDQIRSVARITFTRPNGSFVCSGFLVNNTAQDLAPYFMTANHCISTNSVANTVVAYWNYSNPSCRTPGSTASGTAFLGNRDQNQSGSSLLATHAASDHTLLMLDQSPNPAFNTYWVGWDSRGGATNSAVTVHHPQGHAKRISFENDPTSVTSYLQNFSPGDGTHLRIADWDVGTTEGGSSGSPVFNPAGRAIGELHGGFAACGNNSADWYGLLSAAWNNGFSAQLDNAGTGQRFIDGRDRTVVGDDDDDDDDDGGNGDVTPFVCIPDDQTLCLNNGRFQVTVDFTDFDGNMDAARVVSQVQSDDSGLLYFFAADNWEMLLKVLNGCSFNNHYWVFSAATTNVNFTLKVIDSDVGRVVTYENPLGTSAPAITDVEAFATCP